MTMTADHQLTLFEGTPVVINNVKASKVAGTLSEAQPIGTTVWLLVEASVLGVTHKAFVDELEDSLLREHLAVAETVYEVPSNLARELAMRVAS